MTKLDDTSMMILSGASARTDMKVFPLPGGLQPDEARVKKSLTGLVRRGLLAGVGATRDDVAWAEDEESGRTTLVVTPNGLRAINIEPDDAAAQPMAGHRTIPAATKKPASKTKDTATKEPASAKPAKKSSSAAKSPKQTATMAEAARKPVTGAHKRPTAAKSGKGGTKLAKRTKSARTAGKARTKQEIVISMLRRANGASIAELAKATEWQPHSVRGVLTATIKNRLNLPLISEKGEDGVRRYFVAPIRTGKGKE